MISVRETTNPCTGQAVPVAPVSWRSSYMFALYWIRFPFPVQRLVLIGVCGGKRTLWGFNTLFSPLLGPSWLLAWTVSCLVGRRADEKLALLQMGPE